MKYIFCLILIIFSLTTTARPFEFKHFFWQDSMILQGDSLCRKSNNDCGVLIKDTPHVKTIKWDKWGIETFKRNEEGIYQIDPTAQTDKDDKIDQQIAHEYEQLEYTFNNPYVKLNPYLTAPLSALIKFPTQEPAEITVMIKGIKPARDIIHTFKGFKTQHDIPILGLYPNHKNTVKLTARLQSGQILTTQVHIQTAPLNVNMLYQIMSKKDNKDPYYFSYDGYIHDEYGYIRYYFTEPDMNYMYNNENITEDRQSGLTRYSMLGKKIKHYDYPKGFISFTHGINVTPSGNFLVIGSITGTQAVIDDTKQPTHRDIIIEIDKHTGHVNRQWDLGRVLNPDRSIIVKSSARDFGKIDWCHMNSVEYDSSDQSLLISCRHTGMLKIDYETGKLKWIFGPKTGYDKSGRLGKGPAVYPYVLTAVDKQGNPFDECIQKGTKDCPPATFKWPTKTHDAKIIGNNLYSIFDNSGPVYDQSLYTTPVSVASIFQVDPDHKTVRQVWLKHLTDYSGPGGAVTYVPKDNSVIVYISEIKDKNTTMTYGKLQRYDFKTKEKLFEAVIYKGGWIYKMEPIDFYPH